MDFRYDIGILRAIAVIAVVFFHFQVPYFHGGFIGVDIFFVISGFLMTSILIRDFQKNQFSLKTFYYKRAQRILPALLFMLGMTVVIAAFTLLPKDIVTISKYAINSLLFLSNISYYLSSGYFDNASQSNFFLHTWSLSVEWQFYILYPVLLYPIRHILKQNNNKSIIFVSVLIIVSYLAMLYYNEKDNSFAFYMFPTRAWEMLFGGLVCLLQPFQKLRNIYRGIMSLIGYAILFYCIITYNEKDINWPSIYTVLPVVATGLIILLNWEFKFFQRPSMQFLGKISYSWYLWHWPIFVFCYYFAIKNNFTMPILILSSIALAIFSYYIIERNKKIANIKSVLIASVFCIILCFGISYGNTRNQESEIYYLSHYNENYRKEFLTKQFRRGTCHIDVEHTFEQFDKKGCLFIHPNKDNVLLVGDSHAGALAYSFQSRLEGQDINFLQATVSTTYPLLDTKGPKNSVKVIDYIFKTFLPQHANKIDRVYITGFWGSGQYDYPTLKKKLKNLIAYLKKHQIAYTIIGQTPAYTMTYGDILALEKKLNTKLENKYILKQAKDFNDSLKKDFSGNDYLDVRNIPFIKYQNRQCYMYDDDHLSIFGADQLVRYILKKQS